MNKEEFKHACKKIELIKLINKNFPSDIEGIISFELHFRRYSYNPVLSVRYYDEKGKVKAFEFEVEEWDY